MYSTCAIQTFIVMCFTLMECPTNLGIGECVLVLLLYRNLVCMSQKFMSQYEHMS